MNDLAKKWLSFALFMSIIVGVTSTVAWAKNGQENNENEVKITLDQAPAEVKASIERESHGSTIEEIEKETKDGKSTFEIEVVKDGKKTEIKFAEDGKVIGHDEDDKDEEGDVKLTLDQVPAAVKTTLQRKSQGAEITAIEKEEENGRTVYVADLLKGKEKSEIKVAEDGKFLEREIVVSLKRVPSPVRTTLQKEAQGGKLGEEIEKAIRDGKVIYSADITVGKKKSEIEVSEDGKVLKREAEDDEDGEHEDNEVKVTLDQVPAPVKATLEQESKGGTIGEIEQETEHGQTVYSAALVVNGKKTEVELDAGGKVLKREVDDQDDDE